MTMKWQAARVATLVTVAVLSFASFNTCTVPFCFFLSKTCIQHATKQLRFSYCLLCFVQHL